MKTQWVATRQSSRLKCHGGTPIEELAAKRKQKQNLDIPGNKPKNSFAILNDFSDEVLIQNAKELDILLASDDEGCRDQIFAIKAEERVRANLAEAIYKAYLENLKHKVCLQEDDSLDLSIIDNTQRRLVTTSDSHPMNSEKKQGIRWRIRDRKNKVHVLKHQGL
jgi:hypothetical protein